MKSRKPDPSMRRAALTCCAAIALAMATACSGRTSGTTGSVGVTECDEYVTKVNACMAKEPRMKAMEPGFKAQQDAWKQMAKNNAATVQANCKTALQSLPQSCR
jgi:hypothetical protein